MDTALLLSLVVGLGIFAQWLAWYLKQPSILFLLLIGILAGPVFHFFNPDQVLGDLLFPFISLGVAVILFEGALTLEFKEIKGHGRVVQLLVTLGALITICVISAATYSLFDVDLKIAVLFGALVCVTGPTVIAPLLRSVRPSSNIANVLKWEGIIVDPIGAIAVVLVYEYIISDGHIELLTFGKIVVLAAILGMAGAFVLAKLVKKHWIPDYLRNVFTLSYILMIFALSNYIESESGLLTITILGVALANWKGFPKDHILEFKESLTVLLVSTLFIVLSARVDLNALAGVGTAGVMLLLVAMFVARPLAVFLSSIGSNLSVNEKLMISWIGPRGIVAAAISSLFAIKLQDSGLKGSELLVPLVFTIIIGTVLIQGLSAKFVARLLNVRQAKNNGVLIVGSNNVALMIAKALKDSGIDVLVAFHNYDDIAKARMMGLRTYYGSPISAHADSHLDLIGIGNLFAMSTDRELNGLSELHYRHDFGSKNVFRLKFSEDAQRREKDARHEEYRSRWLFDEEATYTKLAGMLSKGAKVKMTNITESYTLEQYKADNKHFVPLFAVDKQGNLNVAHANQPLNMPHGKLIALVGAEETAAA
ncbi:cation:proton antiporter [Neisseria sp. ZJ106]|uniref:Cation:proton antiporter n=1 Tax=Neisseria lisongii TaxID=2912188 RepID=A0AAW5ANE7_9NEIS|nr:cation:proton antiporter [Neisseria lisongii]MCF7520939.1 cation:proton antiporter [Neisseria lisongii]MCF7528968.1 cation:proton antiporter [Neisseria lisongii]WCL71258.1 cation:proton antiporter [Neisseria lisongii]